MYFRGRSSPLSNMFMFPFRWSSQLFPSLEHAYQYEKALHHAQGDAADAVASAGDSFPAKWTADRFLPRGTISDSWTEGRTRVMLAMLEIKHCQCEDYRRLIDLHSTFVEDTSDAFWGRGRDGRGLNSLGLLHSLVRDGRRRVLITGSSQTRSMGDAYHDANPSTPSLVDVVSISGGTTRDLLGELTRRDLSRHDAILICVGTDDLLNSGQTEVRNPVRRVISDQRELLAHLEGHSRAVVRYASILPRLMTQRPLDFNRAATAVDARNSHFLVPLPDLWTRQRMNTQYCEWDDIHLNSAGRAYVLEALCSIP